MRNICDLNETWLLDPLCISWAMKATSEVRIKCQTFAKRRNNDLPIHYIWLKVMFMQIHMTFTSAKCMKCLFLSLSWRSHFKSNEMQCHVLYNDVTFCVWSMMYFKDHSFFWRCFQHSINGMLLITKDNSWQVGHLLDRGSVNVAWQIYP